MLKTTDAIDQITGVGPALALTLKKNGVQTAEDLIYYFPRKWEDLSHLSPIAEVKEDEKATIKATLSNLKSFRSRFKKMSIVQGIATDESGIINLVWFNQPYLKTSLKPAQEYFLTGQVKKGQRGLQLVSPTAEAADKTPLHSGKIVPIYPETGKLTTKILRRLIRNVLPTIRDLADYLPDQVIHQHHFPRLHTALEALHFPTDEEALQEAKDRLSFDELFLTQLAVQYMKANYFNEPATPIKMNVDLIKQVLAGLPFTLTNSQKLALHEILQDLEKPKTANRILMGDVGSGKTIVIAVAAIEVAKAGLKTAIMAPTEVLATQHYYTLKPILDKQRISLALITQNETIGDTTADIIIGTHALIQEKVELKSLGLVVIDEQHRFGVKQREALKQKGISPHFITLTATPIPRTLALTIFGHLDISVIHTKPLNRKPIITQSLTFQQKDLAYQRVAKELPTHHQAFVIAPLIETSEKLSAQSATKLFKEVSARFPTAKVGLLHGQLDAQTKATTMHDFKTGRLDILVATTVIEVGVDIPNATVMVIEGAERFGLAQLHQLRGRVGRSNLQSYCFAIPSEASDEVTERLDLFAKTLDGFKLAEIDLQLRGPGSLFGLAQSGFIKYRLANWTDAAAIARAQKAACGLIEQDHELNHYPELKKRINIKEMIAHRE
ncbi:MAG: ATP-dependent DNA helicase RecG [Patescibacteria group bacterium]|nr:ATP-dependent DNA helicase RecG [Patescibacteria group bacterium]